MRVTLLISSWRLIVSPNLLVNRAQERLGRFWCTVRMQQYEFGVAVCACYVRSGVIQGKKSTVHAKGFILQLNVVSQSVKIVPVIHALLFTYHLNALWHHRALPMTTVGSESPSWFTYSDTIGQPLDFTFNWERIITYSTIRESYFVHVIGITWYVAWQHCHFLNRPWKG